MPVIVVTGVKETRKALRAFAPDLNKALNSELRKALSPVVKQARGFVPSDSPMSGWAPRAMSENNGRFPFYDASIIKRGIGFTTSPGKPTRSGFVSNASIFNNSPVGQIYEAAGRKNPQGQPWVGTKSGTASKKYSTSVNPHAGEQFIKNLPDLTSSLKGTGRLIYKAWAQNQGKAYGAAMKAIDKAERAFMARTKNETLSKVA
jgi:hypothetical protein